MQQLMSFYAAPIMAQSLGEQMDANRVEVLVLTPEQFMSIVQDKTEGRYNRKYAEEVRDTLKGTAFADYWKTTFYPNLNAPGTLPAGQLGADAYTLVHTLHALGVPGTRVYSKMHKGKEYLIIKGHAGLRNLLQGTRYLATNPQIIQMGLGAQGLKNVAKGGFILGLVVTAGIEVTEFILNDEKTLGDLVGSIGYEAVKSGVVAGLALGFGTGIVKMAALGLTGWVGSVLAVAALPLGVMFVAALTIGVIVNVIDNHFDVKKKVLDALKALPGNIEEGVYKIKSDSLSEMEKIKMEVDRRWELMKNDLKKTANHAIDKAIQSGTDAIKNYLEQSFKQILLPVRR